MPSSIHRYRGHNPIPYIEERLFDDVIEAYDHCLDILRDEADVMTVELSRAGVLLHTLKRERTQPLVSPRGPSIRQ